MGFDDFLLIGKIVGVHGIKGAVKVFSYSETDEPFKRGSFVYIEKKGVMEKMEIASVNAYKNILRINFSGVKDRNEAESLRDFELFIKKEELQKLDDGEFYWFELAGMDVFDNEGSFLGKVESVFPTGSNDVLVVKGGEQEILIPIIEPVILDVDKKAKKISVALPEGLTE